MDQLWLAFCWRLRRDDAPSGLATEKACAAAAGQPAAQINTLLMATIGPTSSSRGWRRLPRRRQRARPRDRDPGRADRGDRHATGTNISRLTPPPRASLRCWWSCLHCSSAARVSAGAVRIADDHQAALPGILASTQNWGHRAGGSPFRGACRGCWGARNGVQLRASPFVALEGAAGADPGGF